MPFCMMFLLFEVRCARVPHVITWAAVGPHMLASLGRSPVPCARDPIPQFLPSPYCEAAKPFEDSQSHLEPPEAVPVLRKAEHP